MEKQQKHGGVGENAVVHVLWCDRSDYAPCKACLCTFSLINSYANESTSPTIHRRSPDIVICVRSVKLLAVSPLERTVKHWSRGPSVWPRKRRPQLNWLVLKSSHISNLTEGSSGGAAAVAAVASRGSKVAVKTWLARQNRGCRTNTEPISILWLILCGLAGFCLIGALSVKKISLCSTGWGWISPGGKAGMGGSFVESEHPRIQSWRGLKCGWILVSFHWTRRGFSGNHILEFSPHFP